MLIFFYGMAAGAVAVGILLYLDGGAVFDRFSFGKCVAGGKHQYRTIKVIEILGNEAQYQECTKCGSRRCIGTRYYSRVDYRWINGLKDSEPEYIRQG